MISFLSQLSALHTERTDVGKHLFQSKCLHVAKMTGLGKDWD